jgi:hypothetical protein
MTHQVTIIGPDHCGKSLLTATAADADARRYVGYNAASINVRVAEGSRAAFERLKTQLAAFERQKARLPAFETDSAEQPSERELTIEIRSEAATEQLVISEVSEADFCRAFNAVDRDDSGQSRSEVLDLLERTDTLLVCIGIFRNEARDDDNWTRAFRNYVTAEPAINARIVLVVTGLDRLLALLGREAKTYLIDRHWQAFTLSAELQLRPVFRNVLATLLARLARSDSNPAQALLTSAIGLCRSDDTALFDHWTGHEIHHPYADMEALAGRIAWTASKELGTALVGYLRQNWLPIFTADPFVVAAGYDSRAAVPLAEVLQWAEKRPLIMQELRALAV